MAIERAQINASDHEATRAVERQPGKAGHDWSADRRLEPTGSPAGLARVPDINDLLRISRGLALDLSTLGLLSRSSSGAFTFLCSTVWTQGGERTRTPNGRQSPYLIRVDG
jgi:hypothetical protein